MDAKLSMDPSGAGGDGGSSPAPASQADMRKQRIDVWRSEVVAITFTCTCSSAASCLSSTSANPAFGAVAAASASAPVLPLAPTTTAASSTLHHPASPTATAATTRTTNTTSTTALSSGPCPSCVRVAAISRPPPIVGPASRMHVVWSGVKRLARKCGGRDGGPPDDQHGHGASASGGRHHRAKAGGMPPPSPGAVGGSAATEPGYAGDDDLDGESPRTDMYSHLREPDHHVRLKDDSDIGYEDEDDLPRFMAQSQARLRRAEKLLERLQQGRAEPGTGGGF